MAKDFQERSSSTFGVGAWVVKTAKYINTELHNRVTLYGLRMYENQPISEALVAPYVHV